MPAHIPASVGGGTSPPCGENQQWQNIQIGPSYYRPTYTAALQYISVLGRTSPLAEKITTNKLENQLTPRSGPQEKIYARPHSDRRREGGAPPSGKINKWQSVQIGPSYYRPTYAAALQYISIHGRTSPLAEKIATNKLENQLTPRSGPQERIYAQPHPGQRREGGRSPWWRKSTMAKHPNWTKLLPTNIHGRRTSQHKIYNWMSC